MAARDVGYKLVAGTANPKLCQAIAGYLRQPLCRWTTRQFTDGEIFVQGEENLRGADVFVIQPTSPPVNDNLMELLIIIDALKRASADRITAVVPYYGYARQEKKDGPREPITARLVADMIEVAGAHRLVTIDLHAGAIQGFFNIPIDHLTCLYMVADHFRRAGLENSIVVAPDTGRAKAAEKLANALELDLAALTTQSNAATRSSGAQTTSTSGHGANAAASAAATAGFVSARIRRSGSMRSISGRTMA